MWSFHGFEFAAINASSHLNFLLTFYYSHTEKHHRRPPDFHRLNCCMIGQYAEGDKVQNLLKKYIERADQDGAPQQNSDNNKAMSCDVCTGIIGENEDLSVNDDEMVELANCHQKETIQNIKLGVELTKTQQEEMMNTLSRHEEIFRISQVKIT